MLTSDSDLYNQRTFACSTHTETDTMAQHIYTWKWIWGDHEDEIISSRQEFRSKTHCQLDGLKHQPSLKTEDLKGRTGHPKLVITVSPVHEFRWLMTIYNNAGEVVAQITENKWYENWVECLNETFKISAETFDENLHWDFDFETREKEWKQNW